MHYAAVLRSDATTGGGVTYRGSK